MPVLAQLHERAYEAQLRVCRVCERSGLFEQTTRARSVPTTQHIFSVDEQLLPGLRRFTRPSAVLGMTRISPICTGG